jgi:hypothetical protein
MTPEAFRALALSFPRAQERPTLSDRSSCRDGQSSVGPRRLESFGVPVVDASMAGWSRQGDAHLQEKENENPQRGSLSLVVTYG